MVFLFELLPILILLQQTSSSFIILVNVYQTPEYQPYSRLSVSQSAQGIFLPGAGEGLPLDGLYLQLHGVISVDGQLQW